MLKFARAVVFLSLLNITKSVRLKLFQKLIEAYTDACKEKNGKDVRLELYVEWKEIKKMKDLDLKIAVYQRISELKKLSTKKKLRSLAIWSTFFSGNTKHSGGDSSQDMDVGRVSCTFFF